MYKSSCPKCFNKTLTISQFLSIGYGGETRCNHCRSILTGNNSIVVILQILMFVLVPVLFYPSMVLTNFFWALLLSPLLSFVIIMFFSLFVKIEVVDSYMK